MKLSNFNLHSVFFFIPITHDLFVEVIYKRQIPEKLALHQMLRHFPRLAQNQILYRFGKKVKYILGCRFMHQKQNPIEQSPGKIVPSKSYTFISYLMVFVQFCERVSLLYFCSSIAIVTISPITLMMFCSQPKNTSANMAMMISSSAFR